MAAMIGIGPRAVDRRVGSDVEGWTRCRQSGNPEGLGCARQKVTGHVQGWFASGIQSRGLREGVGVSRCCAGAGQLALGSAHCW